MIDYIVYVDYMDQALESTSLDSVAILIIDFINQLFIVFWEGVPIQHTVYNLFFITMKDMKIMKGREL